MRSKSYNSPELQSIPQVQSPRSSLYSKEAAFGKLSESVLSNSSLQNPRFHLQPKRLLIDEESKEIVDWDSSNDSEISSYRSQNSSEIKTNIHIPTHSRTNTQYKDENEIRQSQLEIVPEEEQPEDGPFTQRDLADAVYSDTQRERLQNANVPNQANTTRHIDR